MNLLNFDKVKQGKQGQIRNYFVVIAFLFTFGFMAILGYLILSEMVTGFSSTGYWTTTMQDTADNFLFSLQILDYVIIILMVSLMLGVILTSYKLNTSPLFFIVSIIMSTFLGFVSYFFNYIFAKLVGEAVFTATLLYFPNTVIICTNLHWVALATFVVGSIALYAKKESGGGDDTAGLVRQ
jgi:hypothetical protein